METFEAMTNAFSKHLIRFLKDHSDVTLLYVSSDFGLAIYVSGSNDITCLIHSDVCGFPFVEIKTNV